MDKLTNAEKDFIQETCRVALDSRLPIPLDIPLQTQSIDFTDPEQVHDTNACALVWCLVKHGEKRHVVVAIG